VASKKRKQKKEKGIQEEKDRRKGKKNKKIKKRKKKDHEKKERKKQKERKRAEKKKKEGEARHFFSSRLLGAVVRTGGLAGNRWRPPDGVSTLSFTKEHAIFEYAKADGARCFERCRFSLHRSPRARVRTRGSPHLDGRANVKIPPAHAERAPFFFKTGSKGMAHP
jgi:hypothetical protein